MDNQHNSLVRIVGLEPLYGCGLGKLLRVKDTRNFVFLRISLLEHDRQRHGEIRGQWNVAAIKADGFFSQRILQCENAPPALELCDYCNTVKNSRRREMPTRVFVWLAFDGYNWRADAIARGLLGPRTLRNQGRQKNRRSILSLRVGNTAA